MDVCAKAGDALDWILWPRGSGTLSARLQLPVRPFVTNGLWRSKRRAVTWDGIPMTSDGLPPLLFASWSQADVKYQTRRFGKVALSGEDLWDYVLWRRSLSPERGAEWDAFVGELRPGPAMHARLRSFRFRDEPEMPPGASSSDRGCALLQKAVSSRGPHRDVRSDPPRGR